MTEKERKRNDITNDRLIVYIISFLFSFYCSKSRETQFMLFFFLRWKIQLNLPWEILFKQAKDQKWYNIFLKRRTHDITSPNINKNCYLQLDFKHITEARWWGFYQQIWRQLLLPSPHHLPFCVNASRPSNFKRS